MPHNKLTYVILTILGSMALIILKMQSDHIETKVRQETHETQSIRNFDAAEKERDYIKEYIFKD